MLINTIGMLGFMGLMVSGCSTRTASVALDPRLVEAARKWPKEEAMVSTREFKTENQGLQSKDFQPVLAAFKLPDSQRWAKNPAGFTFQEGSRRASFANDYSELTIMDTAVGPVEGKETLSDSSIRAITTALLGKYLPGYDTAYAYTNNEIAMVRTSEKSAAQPEYYFGRFVRKLDGRYMLGNAFQIRLAFGANQSLRYFSISNAGLGAGQDTRVDSKSRVYQMLRKYAGGKSRLKYFTYPYSPDSLSVTSLLITNVFDTYLLAGGRSRPEGGYTATTLVPAVTVLAQVETSACHKRKSLEPLAEGPLLLHFNFPCVEGVGRCWPGTTPKVTRIR